MRPDLSSRLAALSKGVEKVRNYRDIVSSDLRSRRVEVDRHKYKANLYSMGGEVIKQWLEDSLRTNIDSISALCTSGLNSVIRDQDLTFRIVQEAKYNRISMRFLLSQREAGAEDEDVVEGDPKKSFGGGALLLLSFILRLAVMQKLKMGNLLLLDESLHGLANKYVPAAADFMRKISDETGVNILMVTHNDAFMAGAHTAYDAWKDGHTRLRRRRQ